MNAIKGPEQKHPIQVAARRTGLTQDVLRAWERRYRAVSPERTGGGRRLYSDDDIERLILLRRATLAGRAIRHVARMETEDLRVLVETDEAAIRKAEASREVSGSSAFAGDPAGSAPHLAACTEAVRALDGTALEKGLSESLVVLGPAATLEDVVVPLVRLIGDGWREGNLRIMHEHHASGVIRTFLGNFLANRSLPDGAPELVAVTPQGHRHELGALIVAGAAITVGWRATYLGPDLPAQEVAAAVRQRGARALAVSIVYPTDDPGLAAELRRLREFLPRGLPLFAGGAAAGAYARVLEEIGAQRPPDLKSFKGALDALRSAVQNW